MEPDQRETETVKKHQEVELNEVTKTPSIATREKNPKRVTAGKRLAELNFKKRVGIAPTVDPSNVSPSTEESERVSTLYKGLGLVALGVLAYISFTKSPLLLNLRELPRHLEINMLKMLIENFLLRN